ncbi:MAG: PAS domain-containing protein [Polyangiaceae bacterium]|nr:PAS domain-containing protein [Polyangiaceae bacterium]
MSAFPPSAATRTVGLCVLDDAGQLLAADAAWHALAAESPALTLLVAASASDLGPDPGAAGWRAAAAAIRAVARGERSELSLEPEDRTAQGTRSFLLRVTRLVGAEPVRVVVTCEETTELRRARAAERTDEEHLRGLQEHMAETLSVFEVVRDAEGRPVDLCFVELNPAAVQGVGLPLERILARRYREVFPYASAARIARLAEVAATGRPCTQHGWVPTGDGARFMEERCYAAGKDRVAVLGTDHTETEHLRLEKRSSEERYGALAAAIFDGIVVTDGDAIIDANEAYARMHGCARDDMLGVPVFRFVAPAHHERLRRALADGDGWLEPFEDVRADGSTVAVEARGYAAHWGGHGVRITAVRLLDGRGPSDAASRP